MEIVVRQQLFPAEAKNIRVYASHDEIGAQFLCTTLSFRERCRLPNFSELAGLINREPRESEGSVDAST